MSGTITRADLSDELNNELNMLDAKVLPHKLTYKTVSTTVGQSNGTAKPTMSEWNHIKTQGCDATLCVMVGITSATDSNPTMISDSLFNGAIDDAKTAGVKIDMLKLHLGTSYSDGFNRGNYLPSDPSTYFTNWQTICLHYAQLAVANNIPILCIGCEQPNQSLDTYISNWTSIVNAIKALYPNLLLTYAAKTGEFENGNDLINSVLDIIGINVYLTYTIDRLSVTTPNLDDLKKAFYWQEDGKNVMYRINYLCNKYNKPFFVTEIGCMPLDDGLTGVVPWDYASASTNYDAVSWLIQAACTSLFLNLHVIGFAWWHTQLPFTYFSDSTVTSAEQSMINYVKGGLI